MVRYKKAKVHNIPSKKWVCRVEPGVALNGVELQGTVFVGFGSYMTRGQIRGYGEIGRYCSIGRDVAIGLGVHSLEKTSTSPYFQFRSSSAMSRFASDNPRRRVIVGNDVWIGDGVRINSGIRVGDGAVIGAGAVVTKDVPPFAIVGGVPAKFLRWRFSEEIRDELLELKWWEYEPELVKELMDPDPKVAIENFRNRSEDLFVYPQSYVSIRPKKSEI